MGYFLFQRLALLLSQKVEKDYSEEWIVIPFDHNLSLVSLMKIESL